VNLCFDEPLKLGEEKSTPVFEEFKALVREEIPKLITLRSPLAKHWLIFL
jgi:hypothetical protein